MPDQNSKITDKWRGLSFSLRIARRYLFSKKSHNAINVISGVSAAGVAIGTMSLIVVLSVFNGFESLIAGMFSSFDPDLKITLAQGKARLYVNGVLKDESNAFTISPLDFRPALN